MRVITFDIETRMATPGKGRLDTSAMELTVVGIHDSLTDEYSSYLQEELPKLWEIMERADLLVGYNSDMFDIPILNRYYPGDLAHIPSLDLMVEVQKVLGRRLRLDSLARATLGRGKTGDGLKAMDWWAEGKYDLVRKYCIEDVRLTRELYDYGVKNGALKYQDLNQKKDIKIDTSGWNQPRDMGAMTHTLPF
ncbi:MAG: ribonuclease H-like domain-containing protein [Candidatus Pacebacteria bacterium]|nr:ribonuclease H-like domain-containing protein [Candidatus Paceibacterota bacterium]MBP9840666.1 ribonuclease H-like domain-containing protein [Candidatus Paceibacterota bacterium]